MSQPNGLNLLIIVEKPIRKLRIYLDPNHLNQAVRRQHYRLPTTEKLFFES